MLKKSTAFLIDMMAKYFKHFILGVKESPFDSVNDSQ